MSKSQCQSVRSRIIGREGRSVFAPFTGQNTAAFNVFVHAMELWVYGDHVARESALGIMRHAMLAMQQKVRYLCKQVIPAIGDWGHIDEIWPKIDICAGCS